MKKWGTKIYAKCAATNEMKTFVGQTIEAPNEALAHEYCQNNGLGYCFIDGEVLMEIPCKKDSLEPDWNKSIDYEKEQNN